MSAPDERGSPVTDGAGESGKTPAEEAAQECGCRTGVKGKRTGKTFQQAVYDEPVIFQLGCEGRCGTSVPFLDPSEEEKVCGEQGVVSELPEVLRRKAPVDIPALTEPEVVRHFVRLSQMNHGVDSGFYPLGSCTMKYNPKMLEVAAAIPGLNLQHPLQDDGTVQGNLRLLHELQEDLAEIGGMDEVTLQPAAGAQGEWTGLLITRAYHQDNGEGETRTEVILPDTAHGTNPASAVMAGYGVVEIPSREDGCVDLDALRAAVSEKTAAFMITNPSTLGTFETDILEVSKILREVGALLYYDGANLNAIMGKCRPGDMGFDIMHFNLHKTFATPHGGGGPGGGPVGVTKELAKYLPVPMVARREKEGAVDGHEYYLDYARSDSIGKVKGFHGNFGVNVRAWTYIRLMGADGLKEISEQAVLNCNYLRHRLTPHYPMPFKELRKHEFVLSGDNMKPYGLSTRDIAKRLMDYGIHAPTIYFPLVVSEALMIEPTENEPKETLDDFADAMIAIAEEAKTHPELLRGAPRTTGTSRVDEVWSGKNLILTWRIAREKGLEQ